MRKSPISSLLLAGALAALPALAQAQVPTNDRCSTATQVTSGQFVLAVTDQANDDVSGLAGCQTGAPNSIHPDV